MPPQSADDETALRSTKALERLLVGREFKFRRTDGPVLSRNLVLKPDGRIAGYAHPNEHSWGVDSGRLVFRHESGKITTAFDRLDYSAGPLCLFGSFGGEDHIHQLTENAFDSACLAPFIGKPPAVLPSADSVAVLIRSHHCDAKFQDLFAKLQKNRKDYDLFVIMDETRGRPDIIDENVIWHSLPACRAIGLTQDTNLWWCGDFPLYFALRELPQYSHYFMIEYDVEFLEDDCKFVNTVSRLAAEASRETLDFAGVSFRPDRNGGWARAWQQVFPPETSYYATFPMVLVSKRLAAFAFAQRQLEAIRRSPIVHCEGFLPSCAMAAGFNCCDFRDLVPDCYDATIAMNVQARRLGMPLGAASTNDQKVKVVHPVYSHQEFLDRLYNKNIHDGQWDIVTLVHDMQRPEMNVLSPNLVADFLLRLPESVNQAVTAAMASMG